MAWSRRRTRGIAWALLSAGFACVASYATRGSIAGIAAGRYDAAFVGAGLVGVVHNPNGIEVALRSPTLGPLFYSDEAEPTHWWFFIRGPAPASVIGIPLWMPALALLPPGAFLFLRSRPARVGHCPRCNYNLAGLSPGSPCPECGQAKRA